VLDLTAGLLRTGYRVMLVTGLTVDSREDLDGFAQRTGVLVRTIPQLQREIHPWRDVVALVWLFWLLWRERPMIVHTHTSKAGIVGRLAAWLARCPVIIHWPHGHVFYGYFGPLKTKVFIWLERLAAKVTDKIATLTEMEIRDYVRLGIASADRCVTVHCGIDVGRFAGERADGRAVRREWQIEPDQLLVGWVGRLVPVKGCEHFLAACNLVRREVPNARFVIVGDGELMNALQLRTSELGLDSVVRLTGERKDIPSVMAALDLFALSSLNEGLGRVLVEAMASGVPVVATSVGGVPEVLSSGEYGVLVPSGDPRSLADAIVRLLRDEQERRRLGAKGRTRAVEFSNENMVRRFAGLYEELLSPVRARELTA